MGAHAWQKLLDPRENTHSNAASTYLELMQAARGARGESRDGENRKGCAPGSNGSNKRDPREPQATSATARSSRKHALESGQYIPRDHASSARREQNDKPRSRQDAA
jgi:hypothetical protein